MSTVVETKLDGAVLHIRLNRADKQNALTGLMYQQLCDAFDRAQQQPDIKCILLTGAGAHFCAGNDLQDFMAMADSGLLDSAQRMPPLRYIDRLVENKKPLVAAVQGNAVGIGTTMLLHADLVIADESAQFSVPFVPLGLVPEAGASLLLPKRVGDLLARQMLMLGKLIRAHDASAAGLVTELVADAPAQAMRSAQGLAAMPSEALTVTRSLINDIDHERLKAQIETEAELFIQRLRSKEAQQAFRQFFSR